LDYFDQKILNILGRKHNPVTLNELVSACGFARYTVLIHLEHLGSEQLVFKEDKPKLAGGRPQFVYHAEAAKSETPPLTNVVILNFSTLKKACRCEKAAIANQKETIAGWKTVP
jgi:predicted ArsR family transcriptional regulator